MFWPVVLLLCGALCLLRAVWGLSTGETLVRFTPVRRADNPIMFWFSVGANGLFGTLFIAVGVAALINPELMKR